MQLESYQLNWARHLGAQKVYGAGWDLPRIQFSYWAPQAVNVEVVMADLWESKQRNADRSESLAGIESNASLRRFPVGILGTAAQGLCARGDLFRWKRTVWGIWRTRLDDPALVDFRKFDHSPYMFRVTREDGSERYRTDLYSRCQIGFGGTSPSGEYRRPYRRSGWLGELLGRQGS